MSLTTKLDFFIINALNKFYRVEEPWDELKKVTGSLCDYIISEKPHIPDLVIYSPETKRFNKNECFFSSENIKGYYLFPRQKFYVRPQLLKKNNKPFQNEEETLNSIDKVLESKIIKEKNINNIENNLIEKSAKVINKNYETKQDDNIHEKKNDNYIYNDFILKNKKFYNNASFRTDLKKRLIKNNIKDDSNKDQNKNENINLEILYNNNIESRNWQIIYLKGNKINFNNEELYYFLNEIFNDKNFEYDIYIRDSYYGQNYYQIRLVYDFLKRKFNKI